jgi:hypothetical protein
VACLLGIAVLVRRSVLEPAQAELVDRVFGLDDAAGLVRVDGRSSDDLPGVGGGILRDHLVASPDPDSSGLESEDDDLVGAAGCLSVLLGP